MRRRQDSSTLRNEHKAYNQKAKPGPDSCGKNKSTRGERERAGGRLNDPDRFYLMERLASFLAFFSALFSFKVFAGAFLVCFRLSIPLLMVFAPSMFAVKRPRVDSCRVALYTSAGKKGTANVNLWLGLQLVPDFLQRREEGQLGDFIVREMKPVGIEGFL